MISPDDFKGNIMRGLTKKKGWSNEKMAKSKTKQQESFDSFEGFRLKIEVMVMTETNQFSFAEVG